MLWAVGCRPGRGHAVLLSLTPQPLVRMPPSGFPAPCCGNTPASALSAAQYFASTMIIVGLSVVVTVIVALNTPLCPGRLRSQACGSQEGRPARSLGGC